MSEGPSHLRVTQEDDVCVVHLADRKILEEVNIREIEEEVVTLVEGTPQIKLLMSFQNVEHLSSAALGALININKRVGQLGGHLKLSDINPQIFEVFRITRLNKLFDIHPTAAEALAAFAKP